MLKFLSGIYFINIFAGLVKKKDIVSEGLTLNKTQSIVFSSQQIINPIFCEREISFLHRYYFSIYT